MGKIYILDVIFEYYWHMGIFCGILLSLWIFGLAYDAWKEDFRAKLRQGVDNPLYTLDEHINQKFKELWRYIPFTVALFPLTIVVFIGAAIVVNVQRIYDKFRPYIIKKLENRFISQSPELFV